MISKKDLTDLDLSNMDEYYHKIIKSHLEGKKLFSESLVDNLGKAQKKEFINLVLSKQNDPDEVFKLLINIIEGL